MVGSGFIVGSIGVIMPLDAMSCAPAGDLSGFSGGRMFERKYFGFYWTLPVPWAGFRTLPKNVDDAAQLSRTIRYQRDRVRRWVKDEGGTLIGEEVFLELEPDRGTAEITPEIERVIGRCREKNVAIVLINFSKVFHWRPHGPLWNAIRRADVDVYLLDPDSVLLDNGQYFDPLEHFRSWRLKEAAWSASKDERRLILKRAIALMREQEMSLEAITSSLNERGLGTLTGKRWTTDNLRKFIRD